MSFPSTTINAEPAELAATISDSACSACSALYAVLHGLLLRDRALARPLARARIRAGPLTTHRQRTAMPHPAVAADFHQPLDVHRDFLAKVAFDAALLFDHPADLSHVVFRQILHADVRADAGFLQNAVRTDSADAVDIRESDFNPLRAWKINA